MRKIVFLSSFFLIVPAFLLLVSLYFLLLTYNQKASDRFFSSTPNPVSFAALPSVENSLTNFIGEKDVRVDILKEFFGAYHSPLEAYAENVVSAADTYDIDFRLIPAIAMQESNLCKKIIANSFNCWGFGIYGKKRTAFDNYSQAIDTVTKKLAQYKEEFGLKTPEEIMKKYTPSNNGAWANSVNYFINSLNFPF